MTMHGLANETKASGRRVELRDVLSESAHRNGRTGMIRNPFRRPTNEPEISVPIGKLCQSVHIDRLSGTARPALSGKSTTHYYHSVESVEAEIDTLLGLGITSLYLQLYPAEPATPEQATDHHSAVVDALRTRYGSELRLVVDTAGPCMGDDLRWGVRGSDGTIDPEASLDTLADTTVKVAEAGADVVATVGRMNFDAAVARAALESVRPGLGLWGFSTNSETPNAYFDVTAEDPLKALTGQKLLVGNGSEMVLRALRNCHEGVDVLLQRPIGNSLREGHLSGSNRAEFTKHSEALWYAQTRVDLVGS